ncbi:MAG TPA: hypothetical protein VNA86_03415, partial [bacterium]|nr:hypothetical protein [bacterium]
MNDSDHDSDHEFISKLRTIRVNRRALLKAAAATAGGAAIAAHASSVAAPPRLQAAVPGSSNLIPAGKYGSATAGG